MNKLLLLVSILSFSLTQCFEELHQAIRDLDVEKVEKITSSIKEVSQDDLAQINQVLHDTQVEIPKILEARIRSGCKGMGLAALGFVTFVAGAAKLDDNKKIAYLLGFTGGGLYLAGMYKIIKIAVNSLGSKKYNKNYIYKIDKIKTTIINLMLNVNRVN